MLAYIIISLIFIGSCLIRIPSRFKDEHVFIIDMIVVFGILSLIGFIPFFLAEFLNLSAIFVSLFGISVLIFPIFVFLKEKKKEQELKISDTLINGNIVVFSILLALFGMSSIINSEISINFILMSILLFVSILIITVDKVENKKALFYFIILFVAILVIFLSFHYVSLFSGSYTQALNTTFVIILSDPVLAVVGIMTLFGALIKTRGDNPSKYLGTFMIYFFPIFFEVLILIQVIPYPAELSQFVFLGISFLPYLIYVLITILIFFTLFIITDLITNIVLGEGLF
jgi:hypothetical protein